jgi:WD40 repeat protein
MIVRKNKAISKQRSLRFAAIGIVVLLGISGWQQVSAGVLGALFGAGPDSGRLAKLLFELRDDMPVTSIAWSPNGKYIAVSSSQDNRIHVWDVQQRGLRAKLQRETATAEFHSLAWSPDARYLASCDHDSLRLYNAVTWVSEKVVPSEPTTGCMQPAFSDDGKQVAVLAKAYLVTIYSTDDWRLLKRIDLRDGWARGRLYNAIQYLPHGHTLVLGGSRPVGVDRSGIAPSDLWMFKEPDSFPTSLFQAYPYHPPDLPGMVNCLAVSPDGRMIATGTLSGNGSPTLGYVTDSVHILSTIDGSLVGAPLDRQGDAGGQQGLEFTADGRYLIVGRGGDRNDHAVRVIDAHTLKIVDTVHAGESVYDLAVNPVQSEFAVAAGNRIVVWSLSSAK